MTGVMQEWQLSFEITDSGADLVAQGGRQHRTLRYREWRHGPAESKNHGMHENSLHGNREIPGATNHHPMIGPVEEGLWPIAQHARDWEVGRGNIIDEASEQ